MRVLLTIAVVAALSSIACSRTKEYELRGQIVAVDPANGKVTIKHEDIRGFMPAMTMAFDVRDRELLGGRQPGDLITATLVVDDNRVYLSTLTRTGAAPLTETPPPAPVDVIETGELVPDAAFIDAAGRPRRFADWRGQAVAVTFTYTRCPLPNFCPLMDRNFRDVQRVIVDDPALRGRAHLVTVTFDPGYDTPKVLAAHAARVPADPAHWTWLTGEPAAADRFTSRFGVSAIRSEQAAAEIVHNLRTAVIDPQGRLVTILSGNEWTPADLVGHLRSALR